MVVVDAGLKLISPADDPASPTSAYFSVRCVMNEGICDGVKFDLATGKECCSDKVLYNSATESCRNGVLFNPDTEGVCGEVKFDRATEKCCYGATNGVSFDASNGVVYPVDESCPPGDGEDPTPPDSPVRPPE
jgi:hypothetical protein